MPEFPIEPSKTALVFFDCLKLYYQPEDPVKRAEVEASGIVECLQENQHGQSRCRNCRVLSGR